MFAFSGAIHFLFFCFFVRFTMNWTFLATWLWWRRRWRWITMTIYSTELFQALSRLLRRRLSCFWFIFYYVSAMFIKRDTVIINKTTFTVMWFFSRVCVCVSEERERESRCVCLQGKKKKTPPDSLCLWSGGIDCWRCPDPFLLAGSRSGAPKRHNSAFSRKKPWNNNQYISLFHSETESAGASF